MGAAVKGSKNPYFKSSYADLGAVLEACKELLNDNGVVILQPNGFSDAGKPVVETRLLHETGEWVASETAIVYAKEGDPQAQGSAITYARRYGLQSLLSMPAEDDDGEKAMPRTAQKPAKKWDGQNLEVTNLSGPSLTATVVAGDSTVTTKTDVPTTLTTETTTKPRTTFRKPVKTEAAPVVNGKTDDLGLN